MPVLTLQWVRPRFEGSKDPLFPCFKIKIKNARLRRGSDALLACRSSRKCSSASYKHHFFDDDLLLETTWIGRQDPEMYPSTVLCLLWGEFLFCLSCEQLEDIQMEPPSAIIACRSSFPKAICGPISSYRKGASSSSYLYDAPFCNARLGRSSGLDTWGVPSGCIYGTRSCGTIGKGQPSWIERPNSFILHALINNNNNSVFVSGSCKLVQGTELKCKLGHSSRAATQAKSFKSWVLACSMKASSWSFSTLMSSSIWLRVSAKVLCKTSLRDLLHLSNKCTSRCCRPACQTLS